MPLDRLVQAGGGSVFDAEAANRGRPHHGLRHRGEEVADALADRGIRHAERALHAADGDDERDEAAPGDGREDRAVPDHQGGREGDLPEADDQHDPAELDELADRVDIRGHPRDHRAAALGVLGEHR